jgi:hypothetical protein
MMTTTLDTDVPIGKPQSPPPYLLGADRNRLFIGSIGLFLPVVLVAGAKLRPTPGLDLFLNSLSAYYYTSSIALLEGILVALALFLFAYQGYPNKYQRADLAAARVAGVSALVIALFPTYPPEGVSAPSWWAQWAGKVHDGASVVMFLMFATFSLWLFRKTDQKKQDVPRAKQWRNRWYRLCGLTIVASMMWAGFLLSTGNEQIFVPESFAIGAFSLSWLVKGGALRRWMPD